MSTIVGRKGDRIPLTLEDAQAMNAALVGYLGNADPSQLPDRDALVTSSNGPAFIDVDGVLRIGLWMLSTEGDDLVLNYRMPTADGAAGRKEYVATLHQHENGWRVRELHVKYVRFRR